MLEQFQIFEFEASYHSIKKLKRSRFIIGRARFLAGPEGRAGPEDGSSFKGLCRSGQE